MADLEKFFLPLIIIFGSITSSTSLKCYQCGHGTSSPSFPKPEAFKCDKTLEWDCDNPPTTPKPSTPPPFIEGGDDGKGAPGLGNPPPGPPTTMAPTTSDNTTENTGSTSTPGPTLPPLPPPSPMYYDLLDNPNATKWYCQAIIAAGGVMRRCFRTHDNILGCRKLGLATFCLCDKDLCNNQKGSHVSKILPGFGGTVLSVLLCILQIDLM